MKAALVNKCIFCGSQPINHSTTGAGATELTENSGSSITTTWLEYVYNKGGGVGEAGAENQYSGRRASKHSLPSEPPVSRGAPVARGTPSPLVWQTPSLIYPLRPGAPTLDKHSYRLTPKLGRLCVSRSPPPSFALIYNLVVLC